MFKVKNLNFYNKRNILKQNNQFNLYKFPKKNIMDFDPQKDYYKILNVNPKDTDKQIKEAYYKLAKKHHPDLNNGILYK